MTSLRLYGKEPRCWWCGKKMADESRQITIEMGGKYNAAVCSEGHERATENAYAYIKKVYILFPIGMGVGLLLILGGDLFAWGDWVTFIGFAVCGMTLLICPFITPQTVKMIGLKKGLRIGRVAGAAFLIGALTLMIIFK